MRVTIMQPAYLPWLGYIQRAMLSDLLVVLDHVKIDWHSKTQFTNRNRVLTANGVTWLTIPLQKKDSAGMYINTIHVNNNEKWYKKHLMTVEQSYTKSPFFNQYKEFFVDFYSKRYDFLTDAIDMSSNYLLHAFGCTTKQIKSSEMDVSGQKAKLVLNICCACNADTYISGPFGREYLDRMAFRKVGIKVLFHDFVPFEYPQLNHEFVPYLSSVDMLFNVDGEQSAEMLRSNITLSEE
jgi:hypothetical protein